MTPPTATLDETGTHPTARPDVLRTVLSGLQSLPGGSGVSDGSGRCGDAAWQPTGAAIARSGDS